mmetsp:Transcript_96644/g.278129  ORF Transcript_96644/g.278129 Transcript_96644/m.278129 type:complete len:292 (-) Transcript_96644:216-1091(-)
MRLVEVEERFVAILECHDFPQAAEVTLHGIDTLDDDENLAPRLASLRLPLGDRALQLCFQLGHAVVREGPHNCAGEAHALDDRAMVQLVAEDQNAGASGLRLEQSRQNRRVRCEPHAQHQRILLLQVAGHLGLQIQVHLQGAPFAPRHPPRPAVLHGRGARLRHTKSVDTAKAEVVVGAEVHASSDLVGKAEIVQRAEEVATGAHALDDIKSGIRSVCDGPVEAVHVELVHVRLVKFNPAAVPPLAVYIAPCHAVAPQDRGGADDILPHHTHEEQARIAPIRMHLHGERHL